MRTFIMCLVVVAAAAVFSSCNSSDAAGGNIKHVILTQDAPSPIGPYSQAIQFGESLYLSGQIGLDPVTGSLVDGGVVAEANQALKNLGAILAAAGMDYEDAVMATIFLVNMNDYSAVNDLYATYFTAEPPARQVIAVSSLPRNAMVEISLVVMKGATP